MKVTCAYVKHTHKTHSHEGYMCLLKHTQHAAMKVTGAYVKHTHNTQP